MSLYRVTPFSHPLHPLFCIWHSNPIRFLSKKWPKAESISDKCRVTAHRRTMTLRTGECAWSWLTCSRVNLPADSMQNISVCWQNAGKKWRLKMQKVCFGLTNRQLLDVEFCIRVYYSCWARINVVGCAVTMFDNRWSLIVCLLTMNLLRGNV